MVQSSILPIGQTSENVVGLDSATCRRPRALSMLTTRSSSNKSCLVDNVTPAAGCGGHIEHRIVDSATKGSLERQWGSHDRRCGPPY